MKKEIIKPFDLEAYKNGAKVKTRDGHEVRIICTDAKDDYPIIGLVTNSAGDEHIVLYTLEGKLYSTKSTICAEDLVIVKEVEEQEFWSDREDKKTKGYFIDCFSKIEYNSRTCYYQGNYRYFASRKQAKSALAMARISQIMANDVEHFGGAITDEEWGIDEWKFVICRSWNRIFEKAVRSDYYFLAFHTEAQRGLFLEKYRNLVEEYLMIG